MSNTNTKGNIGICEFHISSIDKIVETNDKGSKESKDTDKDHSLKRGSIL